MPNQKPADQAESSYSMGIHPQYVLVALMLFGITAMFLSCTIAYVYTRLQHGAPSMKLPLIFLFNTLILIGSSVTLKWASNAYKKDRTQDYKTALLATVILSFVFLIAQVYGWKMLFDKNIAINDDNSTSYLYVISGLHFLHVIAGLPFLVQFYISARKRMIEPVSVLVYFSDPAKKMRLKLLTWYWHFLDILWIYLIIFFFINAWL